MKTRLIFLFGLFGPFVTWSPAQEPETAVAVDSMLLNGEQLEQLLAPIALYPDALIALMLPAATAPADIVLAARFLADNNDVASVTSRSWGESVKSLAHFPSVVKWMDDNLAWTKQLGEAFRDQPAEVMKAIQRLRAKARAAGTLGNSPEQQVLLDGELITIIPAQPNAIYIPYYDPQIVYYQQENYYPRTYLSFGPAFAVGTWLTFECDWRGRTSWTADRHWNDRDRHDWRRPDFPGQPGYVNDPNRHPWKPTQNFPRSTASYVTTERPRDNQPRPASFNNPPVTRNDSPDRRDNRRGNEPDANRPIAVTTPFVGPTAPIAPTATPTPQPRRRVEPNGERYDSREQFNRIAAAQNPPAISPPANQPIHFPYGTVPSGPLVAPMTGPVIAPMTGPLVSPLAPPPGPQTIHLSNATPPSAPPPPAPPAATPPDDRKRDGREGERKNQPN